MKALARVNRALKKQLAVDLEVALEPFTTSSGKRVLNIDKQAESIFKVTVCAGRFSEVEFYGEERLGNEEVDLSAGDGTCLLVDALDGTDLFERDLGNWCSAAVFFTPSNKPGQRLQVALCGLPDGTVYYATCDEESAFVVRPGKTDEPVKERRTKRKLEEASLCFYGQKMKNLKSFVESGFYEWEARQAGARPGATNGVRIYNFGGIPMMIKLIDPACRTASTIDVVFELNGQRAHDVVAGAFIAMKAKATMLTLNGRQMTTEDLEEALLRPNSARLRYVLAQNEDLATQMVDALRRAPAGPYS